MQAEQIRDKLDELFAYQEKLQIRLGNFPLSSETRQKFINMQSLALIDEIMEAIRETPFKDWKKNATYNEENFKEELVDAWHFLLNLTLASGMDAYELSERFALKNKENHRRQDNGY